MNKNILIALNKLDIGGIETAVINQATQLIERDYKIIILSKRGIYTEKMESKGIKCIEFDFKLTEGYDTEGAEFIEKIIREYEIEQVHIHQFDCITSMFPACVNTNTPYVIFLHTGVRGEFDWFEEHYISYKPIYNMYFNMAEKIVTITNAAKIESQNKYNIPDEKYIILNNSINFEEKMIQNEDYPEELEKFLIIARLSHEKLTSVINSIKLFKKYYNNHKEARLTIVGSGECEKEVINEIEDIKDVTDFLGGRNDVIDIMLKNDVIIGMGRCILEAIACKKIAIISGYEEIIGIIKTENIETASLENFSGRGMKPLGEEKTIQQLDQIEKQEIRKNIDENYSYVFEKLNSNNNFFVLETTENKEINLNKKIYFENEKFLLDKIIENKKEADKVYKDGKECQTFLEEQIANRDEKIKILEEQINESVFKKCLRMIRKSGKK